MTLENAIGKYLIEHPELKAKMDERKIQMAKVIDFIYSQAEKKAGDNVKHIGISDDEVYGWVVHYIEDAYLDNPNPEHSPVERVVATESDATTKSNEQQLDLFEASKDDTEGNKEMAK